MKLIAKIGALAAPFFIGGCTSCNSVTTVKLTWGLLDKTTNVNTQHNDGDTFQINSSDQYTVTLQVQDPESIKQMTVAGSGIFYCADAPDPKTGQFDSQTNLPASIQPQTTTIAGSGSTAGFVMSQSFAYGQLDCGKHQYSNMPQSEEFYVASGTLQIKGTETSWKGNTHTAFLNLHP